MNQEIYYSLQEVADELKVAYLTVYRWVQLGKLRAHQIEKQYRVTKDDLNAFMEARKTNTTPKLQELNRDELISMIRQLKKRKKYGLVWEDKLEIVAEQCKTELPVLEDAKDRAIIKDPSGATNLIIEGDNYHSLSVLNYTHAGKVDVIYIDPPYNTGHKDFIYNDHFVDEEDPYKHSKWLSFMSKRLELAKKTLSDTGIIVVHIDEHEIDNLYLLLSEVFGQENDLGRIIWDKRNPKGDSKGISILHETILCFAKSRSDFLKNTHALKRKKLNAEKMLRKVSKLFKNIGKNLVPEDIEEAVKPFNYSSEQMGGFKVSYTLELANKQYRNWLSTQNFSEGEKAYKYIQENGRVYRTASMAWPNSQKAPDEYFLPLTHPITNKPCPVPAKGWRNPPSTMQDLLDKGLVIFGSDETKQPERKYYLDENMTENTSSILNYGGSDDKLLQSMGLRFDNPKPLYIAEYLLKSIHPTANVILDFFAGSGTTGHAVMNLNKDDNGKRQFILCTNNENNIAEEVTYPRIQKVIDGYAEVAGLPANLRYFKTAFVSKSRVTDDTRRELVRRSTEMICVRENTFEKLIDKPNFKIYKDTDHVAGILFNLDTVAEFKSQLQEQKLPAHIYVFSLSNDTYGEDFADLGLDHELCPIPESILEVYRKLFRSK